MNLKFPAVKYFLCIALIAFFSCGRPVSAGVYTPSDKTATDVQISELKSEVLRLINEYRRENGKSTLEDLNVVEQIADDHSEDMATGRVSFGHDGFENRNSRLKKQISTMNAMAENVAFGKLSASRVVDLWLKSSGHRKNIEGDYNATGIGIARASNGQLYFTQIFIKK